MMDVSSGSELETLSDEASAPFSKTKRPKQSRKFTPVQIIELNTLYRSGMKGVQVAVCHRACFYKDRTD